jgi:aminopeptidase N
MTILSKRSLLLRPMETHDPADFSDVPDFFLAHELAHQWWGHAVAPANYRERWLSEGVAHYAAALWVRHDQGEKAFGDVLDRMAGWARRDTDRGPLFLGRRIGHQKHDSRAYRAVVYDKGAVVLHALAAAVGETAFFTGLQDLQNRRRFETTTTQDLRRSLEAASGQDPEPYLAMWVRSTTLPRLSWSEKAARTAEGWTTNVSVSPASLPGPMPLDITAETLEGAETVHRILPPGGGVFSLTTRGQPRRVTIGAGWMVLLASPPRRQ